MNQKMQLGNKLDSSANAKKHIPLMQFSGHWTFG
jgi:hypothetical protein